MIRKYLKLFVALSMVTTMLVGCGSKEASLETDNIKETESKQVESVTDETKKSSGSVLDETIEKPTENAVVDSSDDENIKITTDSGEKIEINTSLESTEKVENTDGSVTYTTEEGTKVTVKEDGTATVAPAPTEKDNSSSSEKNNVSSDVNETPTVTPSKTETASHSHNYTAKVTKAATCTSKGVKTYTCSCGDSYTEDVAKTGHTASDWIVTKAATCQTSGTKVKTCTVCGIELDSTTIAKTGHTASDWIVTKNATCQAAGSKHKVCTVCSTEIETASIAKSSEHTYVWTHVSNGDYKVALCSGCGVENGTRAYNLGNNVYGYYDDEAAAELFECVNTERNSAHTVIRDEVTLEVIGLTKIPSLIWRDEDIAKKRALDIVTKFSHDGYLTDNENLAKGQGTAVDVHCDWCFSSTHAQTMLSIDYVYGSTACLWVDSDGNGTMYPYWTLVLSRQ